ncbi:hypothetical protein ABJF43_002493 [Listeria monocytogenes]|uniref:DUF2399 domain-containing protein n=1 Tax=Listeria monocytogenes TaxID=1639 RepID=A0A9P1SWR4_LISMN|nr:hypothetical protein [Listeria monocytogenes]MCZ64167.1 hypothetical protein [Listeria monocytogenes serotype 4b]EAA0129554.1 hypothetical protein [Listeria monocytogenes]EAC2291023.1 hypothetical protein [Listeria monocytogenes]EAC2303775.1 hypothetical protein [Listeria monocytogenes]EAC3065834.1 hypothetical protein [Listeria monocytogenes]
MSKIVYKEMRFRADSLALIEKVNQIIKEYHRQGYELTLRQVYYQLVANGIIENKERSYKNLGSLISNARLAGLIDWNAIVDRTRFLRGFNYETSPENAIKRLSQRYGTDPWAGQKNHVEVWVEKDALVDIVGQASNKLNVNYFSCRGYVSQSAMFRSARRLANWQLAGKDITILHLGDHDPSGIDMSRDIEERLATFEIFPDVKRIALNMDQVDEYTPVPNPTKLSDSRAADYISQFGYESWELDALQPRVIDDLISEHINPLIDWGLMESVKEECEEERRQLETVSYHWANIIAEYT